MLLHLVSIVTLLGVCVCVRAASSCDYGYNLDCYGNDIIGHVNKSTILTLQGR